MPITPKYHDERGTTLLELMIVVALLGVVIWAAMAWLIEANRAVATTTDRAINNTSAQSALDLLDSNLRFAYAVSISTSGSTLYVQNDSSTNAIQPTCAAWTAQSGNLVEKDPPTSTGVTVAQGVSSLSFSGGNSAHNGLVTVAFTLNQNSKDAEATGVPVIETLSASNMTGAIPTVSSSPC